MRLKGTNAIISGGSLGFGFEIAKQFVSSGANVLICSRNIDDLKVAFKELSNLKQDNQILIQTTDVSAPIAVNHLIDRGLAEFGTIDVLVANAAIYGPKGPIEAIDWQAWSDTIDINLKGTVLQCKAILPHFKEKQKGKIIILSGGGATKPMPYLSAYAASKAGVVRFAETLALETKDHNIQVNCVAPGALNTRLLDEVLTAGPEKVGAAFYEQAIRQKETGGTPLEKAAELCTFLASSESKNITGKLISAIWDPWKTFAEFSDELNQSDIYTLRRIVPEDRNKNWGAVS